jgi:hypothetical protein
MTEEEADAFARKFYEGWDPYGGQSVVDREAELNALLAEQGYLEDLNKPYGELPVFLTDLIGEYPTIGGNILPGDQGTAVAPTPAPVDDTDAQIRAWFEANPNATAQDVFNIMQSSGVSPETVINAMGFDPESAMATYNTFLNPATAPAPPPATGGEDILDVLKGLPGAAVDTAKSAADTLLKQIQEFLPFYDQSQVVLNPTTGQATIVFGTPPSGSPVIQAGNLPKSNTNVGVTTGIPILDQAINSVLGKEGGLSSGSIRDEVIKVISEQAGLDPASTAGILGEDLDTILATANAEVADTASRLGVDLTGKKEVTNDTGTNVVKNTDTPVGDDFRVRTDGKVKTKGDLFTGGDSDTPPKVTSDSVDIVLGDGSTEKVPKAGGVFDGGDLTPEDLGEGELKTPSPTEKVPKAGVAGVLKTPATPAPSQGMRMESTEKAGLAEIDNTFDPSLTFAENLMRVLSGKDDTESEASYYSGGKVAPYAGVDEIIRLLRG